MDIIFAQSAIDLQNTDQFFFKNIDDNEQKFIFTTQDALPPINTTIYDSQGNIIDSIYGDIPMDWKLGQEIDGYVVIGSSATNIGFAAFFANSLTSVVIGNFVTEIAQDAFANNLLTSIIIPNSVITIGVQAFGYNMISSVIIGSSVNNIQTDAFSNNPLTNVTLASGRSEIPDFFAYEAGLVGSLSIPNTVTRIGTGAFILNNLTSITIPNSVTSIEESAFGFNFSLTSINCYAPQTAFTSETESSLIGTPPLTIHVRSTDTTWTAGTNLFFDGNNNVTVIKDLDYMI